MKTNSENEWSPFGPLHKLAEDESGATAIEYALIAGGISIAIIVAVFALGGSVGDMYTDIAGSI